MTAARSSDHGPPAASGPGRGEGKGAGGEDRRVPFSSSFTVQRAFRVDGKRVVVQAVLPAAAAQEIGMEAALRFARRLLVRVESKEAHVDEIPSGG